MSYENQNNGEERREYERLDRDFRVSYCRSGNISHHALDRNADLLDIGGGGMRFLAEELLEEKTQLILEVEFSGWQVDDEEWTATGSSDDSGLLRVIATVMRCVESRTQIGKYEVGVCFSGRIH